jgi:hypothetical protein
MAKVSCCTCLGSTEKEAGSGSSAAGEVKAAAAMLYDDLQRKQDQQRHDLISIGPKPSLLSTEEAWLASKLQHGVSL